MIGLAAWCIVGQPPAARADMIVVASTTIGMGPGHVIADGATVSVPEGASLTLLDQSGKTVVIAGPFDGAPTASAKQGGDNALVSALASLINRNEKTTSALGASRSLTAGGDIADRPVSAVDIAIGGTYCLTPGAARLFRHDSGGAARITLRDSRSAQSVGVRFAAGQTAAPWPAALALEHGREYVVQSDDQIAGVRFTVKRIDVLPQAPALAAKALAEMECDTQAQILLRQIAAANQQPGLFLTSDRGRTPRYAAGETATLTLQSNFDANLYCFFYDRTQGMVTVYPHQRSVESRIAASRPVSLPGSLLPVAFQMSEQDGDARFLCFATDRDVRASLPAGLLREGFAPVRDVEPAQLKEIFGRLPVKVLASSELKIDVAK
jgi:hypothetical protein